MKYARKQVRCIQHFKGLRAQAKVQEINLDLTEELHVSSEQMQISNADETLEKSITIKEIKDETKNPRNKYARDDLRMNKMLKMGVIFFYQHYHKLLTTHIKSIREVSKPLELRSPGILV